MCLTQMALSGSVLILCILTIRALALHRLPKTLFLILWEMAALRLLLPIAIPVPSGLLPLPALHHPQAETLTVWPALLPDRILPVESTGAEPGLLTLLWGLGTVAFGIWFFRAYRKSRRVFHASLPVQTPEGTAWLAAHPIRRRLELRESDQIGSPLTYGIFHPVILLPKGIPPETLEAVLTHEYVHVRRFDALAKLVFAAVLCLHWWNPLVWVLYVLADRDMELACDAAVLHLLGEDQRKKYAVTLLDLEERRLVKYPLCSYFSENLMKERIASIMKFKQSTSAALAVAVVLTLGATAAFAVEKKAPTFDALKDTESALPYGTELDLSDFQTMKLEDGSTLYTPKETDLKQAQDEGGINLVTTYTVSSDQNAGKEKSVALTDLPKEFVEPTEEYLLDNLMSVKHSDQSKFTPEEWAEILEKTETGKILWED